MLAAIGTYALITSRRVTPAGNGVIICEDELFAATKPTRKCGDA